MDMRYGVDYDDHHAFIAGHTSGGAAYGITWEEAKNMDESVNTENHEDDFDFIQEDISEQANDPDYNGNNKEDETDDEEPGAVLGGPK